MSNLYDSIRDPWRAARLGASTKKGWVAFKAVMIGWLFYFVLGHAAHLMAGARISRSWRAGGFFPGVPEALVWSVPYLLWVSGVVGAALLVLVGAAGVAKLTYRQLKGDDFYGASDAWRFAIENGPASIGTPLLLAVIAAGGLITLWLMGLLARIPAVGPVLFGLLVIPAVIVSLCTAYLLIGFLLSLLIGPSVVGCTGEDAMEGAIQCLGLLWTLPWRLVAYAASALLSTAIGVAAGAALLVNALAGGGMVLSWGLGNGFQSVTSEALAYLPLEALSGWADRLLLPALRDPYSFAGFGVPGGGIWAAIGGLLGGLALLGVLAALLSYAVAAFFSGMTAAYLSLRAHKDGEDLLAWADEIDELE